jgi:uncharacterized protein YndB with AHSA1/START domain
MKETAMTGQISHASFTIERDFPQAPARVFAAWSDPAIRQRWFVDDPNFAVSKYSQDFRIGGSEKGRFSQDGKLFYYNDTIVWHIVPDRRIVMSYTMGTDAGPFSASLATVEISPKGKGSHVLFTEQAAFFDNADGPEMRKAGWTDLIDKLAKEIAS